MEIAGLVFGSLATADLCVRGGKKLVALYNSYKDAEQEVIDLLLDVQNKWFRIQAQLELMDKLWGEMKEDLKLHQTRLFERLQQKLQSAYTDFDNIIGAERGEMSMSQLIQKRGRLNRMKYTISIKKHLTQTVDELEKWQSRFDLSWWLTSRVQNAHIDQQLIILEEDKSASSGFQIARDLVTMKQVRNALYNPANETAPYYRQGSSHRTNPPFSSATTLVDSPFQPLASVFVSRDTLCNDSYEIPYSCCRLSKLSDSDETVIIDVVRLDKRIKVPTMIAAVRDLANVLSRIDSTTFGLLACSGVVKVTENETRGSNSIPGSVVGFDIILRVPQLLHIHPYSLRQVLLTRTQSVPLDEWILMAKNLARSVVFIHASRFVHKNIRPETVLIFKDGNLVLGLPFLTGFERFRIDSSDTHRYGDTMWERNLYRHPKRQGLHPEESYNMRHDIYSLGVMLLEMGLRISFVLYRGSQTYPHPDLQLNRLSLGEWTRSEATQIKEHLVYLAQTRLPAILGPQFMKTVVSCLCCLDEGNEDFGNEGDFSDEDGVVVGVRYIEKVVLRLESISV